MANQDPMKSWNTFAVIRHIDLFDIQPSKLMEIPDDENMNFERSSSQCKGGRLRMRDPRGFQNVPFRIKHDSARIYTEHQLPHPLGCRLAPRVNLSCVKPRSGLLLDCVLIRVAVWSTPHIRTTDDVYGKLAESKTKCSDHLF